MAERKAERQRILSGIQPSGDLHIGNYLGAISHWAALLDSYDSIFSIVDYHAITIPYDSAEMPQRVFRTAAVNIACGLDPERSTIFVQSAVAETMELAWILNTVTSMGDLGRMTQYKEKAEQHAAFINAGLLNYPILQAADIMIVKADAVPVGEDQAQHLELTRDIARRFNTTFGATFPEPRTLLSKGARIMGLDGQYKMSKSRNNYIGIVDPPEEIRRKLGGAFTDPNRKRRHDPGNPAICNIYTLHQFYSKPEQIAHIYKACRTAEIGCVECKEILADNLIADLEPIQRRYRELMAHPDYVWDVLDSGARRVRTIARETMAEVREKMGIGKRWLPSPVTTGA